MLQGESRQLPTLTADEAMKLLGVQRSTLYAYVSRGYLRRWRGPDRRSRFLAEDVERVRERGRRRSVERPLLSVQSTITAVSADALFFRGLNALDLARTSSFEEGAAWLWTGSTSAGLAWTSDDAAMAVGRAVQEALPATVLPLDRLRVSAAAIAATDPLRYDTGTEAVLVTARRQIAALVDCLPMRTGQQDAGGTIAARLWMRLGGADPRPEHIRLLDAVLVLLLDHELSMSTLSARLAASIQADPYAVVSVGLSALGGPLHAVASLAAEDLLAEIRTPDRAAIAIGDRLRRGDRVPGLGHRLHTAGDPRARFVLDAMREVFPAELGVLEALLRAAAERSLPPANIDMALAALVRSAGMVRGASEAIFAVARSAGWIAHALEVYAAGDEAVPSVIYVGSRTGPER